MTTETRTYNSRLQLTRIGNLEYRYSPNQNNGQITQQKDWSSGEEVTYAYDSLQRLISAVTTDSPTVPQWGQSFTYDGFGNRTSATPIKGSAPYGNWSYDPATNRGGGTFDANGNMTSVANLTGLVYDVENRLVSVPTYNQNGSETEQYAYDASNKRIYKRTMDGTEEFYFYGISGQKLGTYHRNSNVMQVIDTNVYFGSRTIVSRGVAVQPDRLGSNFGSRYFPYGEEKQVTAQDRDKFATYYRDGTTGLDYAQNRYYASTLGRFITPDPYVSGSGTGDPAHPDSWNRFAYVANNPINRNDPSGLFAVCLDQYDTSCPGTTGPELGVHLSTTLGEWDDEHGDPHCGGQGYSFQPNGHPYCALGLAFAPPPPPPPKRVPLIFQFVKGRPYSTCPTPTETTSGAYVSITYRILDQYGMPLNVGGLRVQESITNARYDVGIGPPTPPDNSHAPYADFGEGHRTVYTSATGQFLDQPFGLCSSSPVVGNLDQSFRVFEDNTWYYLGTQHITVYSYPPNGTLVKGPGFGVTFP